ncbi:hypothetical protein [Pseudochelatococcus lubricantis]|uniref:hypothetical protein n=1 Tax=Pseudochelatococcus lubricantis TaxID=1538102 RepID=UPI00362B2D43
MCGADPDEIDHVNGIRSDNRFNNLRNVDHAANTRNVALHSSNTSGVIGVSWAKRECRWRASIKANNRERHIGYFRDFEDAVAARKAAERQFGFHKNHGRLP